MSPDPGRPAPMVIVPAWNEAPRIGTVVDAILREAPGARVVVIDDGSTDRTGAVARAHGAEVVSHPFNLGYGGALQTGYKLALASGAPLLVQMDADGQHDPAGIPALLAPLLRDECDLVIGSRFLGPSDYRMGRLQSFGRHVLRWLAGWFALELTDPTSGLQAMNRAVLQVYALDFYPSDYPDVDVLVAARRNGLRIREVPVRMHPALRASVLHGGLRDLHYAYKMLLSLWATSSRRGRETVLRRSDAT